MQQALKDYRIVGLSNNLRFLKRIFDNAVFQQGDYDTGFIEQHNDTLLDKAKEVDPFDLVTAVVARNLHFASRLPLPSALLNYRNVKGQIECHTVTVKDTALASELTHKVEVTRDSNVRGTVTLDGKEYQY